MNDIRLQQLSRGVEVHELPGGLIASTKIIKRPHTRRRQFIRRWRHRMAELQSSPQLIQIGGRFYATREAISQIKAGSITHVSMEVKQR